MLCRICRDRFDRALFASHDPSRWRQAPGSRPEARQSAANQIATVLPRRSVMTVPQDGSRSAGAIVRVKAVRRLRGVRTIRDDLSPVPIGIVRVAGIGPATQIARADVGIV